MQLSVALVVHDHGPFGLISGLGCVKAHMEFDNFEWLQAESRFNFLLDNFRGRLLGGQWVLGARICLRLYDIEGAIHREVESQVGLCVVREGQLLDHVRSIVCCDCPFLNLNLFAAFKSI